MVRMKNQIRVGFDYWGGRIIKFGEAKFDYFSTPNGAGEESNSERL